MRARSVTTVSPTSTGCLFSSGAAGNCSVSRACEALIVAQPVSGVAATVNSVSVISPSVFDASQREAAHE